MSAAAAAALAERLRAAGLSQREFARRVGLSRSSAHRLLAGGAWPKTLPPAELRQRIDAVLPAAEADGTDKKASAGAPTPAEAEPRESVRATTSTTEDMMLLKKCPLTAEARKHFGLARDPFGEPQAADDVYVGSEQRYLRAALLDCALHHGFVALIGESGSGKTTLREELEERIRCEQRPVVVIKPYVMGMERSETAGRPLRAGHIGEAIVAALAPAAPVRSSPEARFRQCHQLLQASRAAGYAHLLVIEEAHRLPVPTLKHLKGFLELKDGLRRLIGVLLIGQPELRTLLSEHNPEVREIVQRCEQLALPPLDEDLRAYLTHRFERVGATLTEVLAADAIDALRARLVYVPRGGRASEAVSLAYPQVVHNLLARAMNAAAAAGWPKVDAQVIARC